MTHEAVTDRHHRRAARSRRRDAAASIWARPRVRVAGLGRAARGARLRGRGPRQRRGGAGRKRRRRRPGERASICRRSRQPATRLAHMVSSRRSPRASCRWCSAAIIRSRSARSRALSRFFRESRQKIGLLWIDAHADMNTPRIEPQRQRSRHAARLLRRRGPGRTDATCSALRPRWTPRTWRWWAFAMWIELERGDRARYRRARLHHARYRRARHARRDGRSHRDRDARHRGLSSFARHGFRRSANMRPASARRCAAASPIAKRTSPWK